MGASETGTAGPQEDLSVMWKVFGRLGDEAGDHGSYSGLYQTQSISILAGKSDARGAGSQSGATAKFAMK